jgi:dihydrodipicolinate synthase/N-acetylneuraminate lyase
MADLRRPWLVVLALVLTLLQGCASVPTGGLTPRRSFDLPHVLSCGIYPTVITPYCETGIDVESLERQLRHELAGGVHGLLVLGTLGEGEYLSMEERAVVISTAVRVAAGCVPIVVGIHTCDVNTALILMQQAKELGATAVLVKYIGNLRASDGNVIAFFAHLSEAGLLPILYYHYPSQTGIDLSPRAIAVILSLPWVIGIKESTLNLRDVQAHIRLTSGQGKLFFTATALSLTQFMELGGHGAMCPEAVLLPAPTVQAYTAYVEGRTFEARRIQSKLFLMAPILRDRPLPPAILRAGLMTAEDLKLPIDLRDGQPQARLKAALNYLGIPTPTYVRPPLPPLTAREDFRVRLTVKRLQAVNWSGIGSGDAGPQETEAEPRGLLLKPGALLLGPGAGEGLWGWHDSGPSGF